MYIASARRGRFQRQVHESAASFPPCEAADSVSGFPQTILESTAAWHDGFYKRLHAKNHSYTIQAYGTADQIDSSHNFFESPAAWHGGFYKRLHAKNHSYTIQAYGTADQIDALTHFFESPAAWHDGFYKQLPMNHSYTIQAYGTSDQIDVLTQFF